MTPADDVRTIRVRVGQLIPGDLLLPTERRVLSPPHRRLGIPATKRCVTLRNRHGSISNAVWNDRTIVTVRRDPLDTPFWKD